LSYGTCTDTGRVADLLASVSSALGGVPIPELPVAAVAPEYMEQKATIDAVTGAPNLVKLLTEECKDVTGGQLDVETDPVKAADKILAGIEVKRKKLGI
jgi:carbon-monoxide dehydrogenase catalytic subunit